MRGTASGTSPARKQSKVKSVAPTQSEWEAAFDRATQNDCGKAGSTVLELAEGFGWGRTKTCHWLRRMIDSGGVICHQRGKQVPRIDGQMSWVPTYTLVKKDKKNDKKSTKRPLRRPGIPRRERWVPAHDNGSAY